MLNPLLEEPFACARKHEIVLHSAV